MSIADRIERIGARAIGTVGLARDLGRLFGQTVRAAFVGNKPKGETVNQMYVIGNKSLLFVAVTLGFIGMVSVYQTGLQLQRVFGDMSQIGPEFIKLLIQDFGPTLTALMLATRVGAGIAAEVGSMKVTEQIDALRMSGITPVDYIVAPRFIASVVMTYVLAMFGIIVAYGAAGFTAYKSFQVNPKIFFDISRVGTFDITLGLIKTLSYGMAIPVVSSFCGMRAHGSSEGVGSATTAAVIGSSFAVIVLSFIISGVGFIVKSGAG